MALVPERSHIALMMRFDGPCATAVCDLRVLLRVLELFLWLVSDLGVLIARIGAGGVKVDADPFNGHLGLLICFS